MPRPSQTAVGRSRGRSLRVETLEDRRVLSATLEMLTDVGSAPQPDDSNPYRFVEAVGLTYFTTRPSPTGQEQTWVTNGTTNATRLLSEFMPDGLLVGGVAGNVAGKLYFGASDSGPAGYRLWEWDGIGSKPTPVLSAAGDRLRSFTSFVDVDGVWYFSGQSGAEGPELWRTDGTQAGTYLVKEIRPGTMGGLYLSNLGHQPTLFNVDGTLMFIANDGTHGGELWTSDGTEAGTVMVKDIRAGSYSGVAPSSFFGNMAAVVGDLLYFNAAAGPQAGDLWRSDGTEAGTYRVKDIGPGNQGSTPQHLTNVGGTLYFAANDGTNGNELWKSDGTESGTALVKNIESSLTAPGPFDLTEMDGRLYFGAGETLWCSDGTEAGTTQVLDDFFIPTRIGIPAPTGAFGQKYSNVDNIVNLHGNLYFAGRDSFGSQRTALWKYEGAGSAARLVSYSTAGSNSYNTFETINFLTVAGDRLYFAGDSSSHGNEPWISDGTTAGTRLVKDTTAMGSHSGAWGLTNVDGTLHFTASTGLHPTTPPRGWWSTDGTINGTTSYANIPGRLNGYSIIGSVGGLIFFKATSSGGDYKDWELWRTDGTTDGTFRVKDIRPGAESAFGDGRVDATEVNGILYFRANDGVHGSEIWRTDGTEAGTRLLVDLNPGPASSQPIGKAILANVGGTLYFAGTDGNVGHGLWSSDGSAGGTTLVRRFNAVSANNLTNVSGVLYFTAGQGSAGNELWRSDGTELGTTQVRNINRIGDGISRNDVPQFTNVDGTLFFIANDGIAGYELWKSDGTEAGTMLVKDIRLDGNGLSRSGHPRFTVAGSTLYFYANDGVHGYELWKSDGTDAGTMLVKDVFPGSSSSRSDVVSPVEVGGVLYFAATDGVGLWRSDGTEAGTYPVPGLNRTSVRDVSLRSLTNVNGLLYFVADDGVHGQELWVLRPEVVEPLAGDYNSDGRVDGADFLAWQRGFGSVATPAGSGADGDGDGTIGGGDLDVWKERFGAASAAMAAVTAVEAVGTPGAAASVVAAVIASENFEDEAQVSATPEATVRDRIFAAGDFSRLYAMDTESDVFRERWRKRR